jgi:RNA polymerase sigma-B factor
MSRTPSAQERALLRRYHVEGDLEARRELIERMLPFVRRIARRYANKGVPLDDLIQVGCIGLIKAIDRFDLSRGVRLTSFAEPNIAGEIKRHFRDHGWSVHMPRDLQELHARITRETERLSGTLGRGPTAQELAERLECPPERVVEALLAARSYDAGSLDAASDETGEPQVNRLGGPDPEFDRADRMLLLRAGARSLPPRQRRIVHLRYFHDLSQREIAREVGVSQMHVSRLLQQSLHQLRAAIDGDEDRRAA